MRLTPLGLAVVALLASLLETARPVAAAPVLAVDGPRATMRDDPYLPAGREASPPGGAPVARAAATKPSDRPKPKPTFSTEVARYLQKGLLDGPGAGRARAAYDRALRAARALGGQRRRELLAVLATVDWMAEDGRLAPTRVPALTLTLERNRELWAKARSLPASRGRVEFAGSEIVWEYYAGQGLQIQPLGTFGKANGLWTAGTQDARLRRLFEEMVPLAARRGDALAWEYYFFFGGGRPPWASGMAQATGLQALSRAINRLGEQRWRALVPPALSLFELPSPTGVRVPRPAGNHYLQYSFAPRTRIINAFLQSVAGLYETADQLGDPRARRLAELGDAQARAELRLYDTGAWSLYELGGGEASLDYFQLARSFLERLCERLATPVYCDAFDRWGDYLRTPPQTRLVTTRAVAQRPTRLRFTLDKGATVGVAVDDPAGRRAYFSEGRFGRGSRFVTFTPRVAGPYAVRIDARDVVGNRDETSWTLEVAPAPEPPAGEPEDVQARRGG